MFSKFGLCGHISGEGHGHGRKAGHHRGRGRDTGRDTSGGLRLHTSRDTNLAMGRDIGCDTAGAPAGTPNTGRDTTGGAMLEHSPGHNGRDTRATAGTPAGTPPGHRPGHRRNTGRDTAGAKPEAGGVTGRVRRPPPPMTRARPSRAQCGAV